MSRQWHAYRLVLAMLALAIVIGGARGTTAGAPVQDAADAAVRETLQRYSTALESRDAEAVRKVHPSIPAESLAKAFKDMRELKVVIDAIRVLSIDGIIARVSCRVTQTLTPKAGAKRTSEVTRVVRLRRLDQSWVIDSFER
jgi:hypothetical protein